MLELVGLHAHIGSQIFELEPYRLAIAALGELAGDWCKVVDVGGGLGVAYTEDDRPPAIDDYVGIKVDGVREVFGDDVRMMIEPGRSLVANAGVTAYRVGTVKEIPGVRTYLAVDGGMSDNLRPMLYGSRYEALIADRVRAEPDTCVTVAGMHCESGDVIVRDAMLRGARGRRRPRHPGDRRLRPRDGLQLQRRDPAAGDLLLATARPASSSAARPSTTSPPAMSEVAAATGRPWRPATGRNPCASACSAAATSAPPSPSCSTSAPRRC